MKHKIISGITIIVSLSVIILVVNIPGAFEPSVRSLGATDPVFQSR